MIIYVGGMEGERRCGDGRVCSRGGKGKGREGVRGRNNN
jgi:hypothetical protein